MITKLTFRTIAMLLIMLLIVSIEILGLVEVALVINGLGLSRRPILLIL